MIVQERESGILVATEQAPPPPEHAVCGVIRDAMAKLSTTLDDFCQTTHCHAGNGSIEDVTAALVRCYREPGAYTISDLAQAIDSLTGA